MAKNLKAKKGRGRSLRVLVDMDGVLCDFEAFFLEMYRKKYPDSPYIPLEERRTFYLNDQYKAFGPDAVANMRSVTEAQGFFRDIPPIPDAVDALKEMSGLDNVEVFICTSQMSASRYCAQEKFEWIEEHLGRDWIARVIITKDKTIIAGDLLFDDKPKIKGIEKEPMWHQVLFTACHNKHLDLARLQARTRLDSWENKDHWMHIIRDYLKKVS